MTKEPTEKEIKTSIKKVEKIIMQVFMETTGANKKQARDLIKTVGINMCIEDGDLK